MNKVACVVFAYNPKNDDELELAVGDKIEVIGFEEEGWWRGRLRGRIGVFPSNFVQVVETSSSQTISPASKLSSIFGSKASSRNSVSANSLDNIPGNNNNLSSSNSANGSNNNLTMNNTQPIPDPSMTEFMSAEESSELSQTGERRPKPLRGIGYGDIFSTGAKAKQLPVDSSKPSLIACDRVNAPNMANTLQIPKKPPPPAPSQDSNGSPSTTEQAPALPPKPNNQFGPYLNQNSRSIQQQATITPQRIVREQAKVVFAYKPSNSDELEMEVGDVIEVIDKNIEDAGWWKGELRGKIGVFPDNFVQLIRYSSDTPQSIDSWQASPVSSNASSCTQQQQQASTENKIKSVFAGAPKGFSKELENNLEKHGSGNPASFLSLKRNKIHQVASSVETGKSLGGDINNQHKSDMIGLLEPTSSKLNHITANRTRGPTRKLPSNLMNNRNLSNDSNRTKIETDPKGDNLNDNPHAQHESLPIGAPHIHMNPNDGQLLHSTNEVKAAISLDHVSDGSTTTPKTSQRNNQTITQPEKTKPASTPPWMVELRKTNAEKKRDSSKDLEEEASPPTKTKTNDTPPSELNLSPNDRKLSVQSLRDNYDPTTNAIKKISTTCKYSSDVSSNSKITPQQLQAETFRAMIADTIPNNGARESMENRVTSPVVTRLSDLLKKASPPIKSEVLLASKPVQENGSSVSSVPSSASILPAQVKNNIEKQLQEDSDLSLTSLKAQCDNFFEQISKKVADEIGELRADIKHLQAGFSAISDLKTTLETLSTDLKVCQSATENQKRYIKELVTNLADERKKIAAMQTELDRNFK